MRLLQLENNTLLINGLQRSWPIKRKMTITNDYIVLFARVNSGTMKSTRFLNLKGWLSFIRVFITKPSPRQSSKKKILNHCQRSFVTDLVAEWFLLARINIVSEILQFTRYNYTNKFTSKYLHNNINETNKIA